MNAKVRKFLIVVGIGLAVNLGIQNARIYFGPVPQEVDYAPKPELIEQQRVLQERIEKLSTLSAALIENQQLGSKEQLERLDEETDKFEAELKQINTKIDKANHAFRKALSRYRSSLPQMLLFLALFVLMTAGLFPVGSLGYYFFLTTGGIATGVALAVRLWLGGTAQRVVTISSILVGLCLGFLFKFYKQKKRKN